MPTPAKPIPILRESDKKRFLAKVSITQTERGCMEWTASTRGGSYGSFSIGGTTFSSHRVAYAIHYGVDPGELLVCHVCDNRACCNPAHFFLGTYLDNNRDMETKGRKVTARGNQNGSRIHPERLVRGESVCTAKLKATDIPAIRSDHRPQRKIAAEYGVSQRLVSQIKRRKLWHHVA